MSEDLFGIFCTAEIPVEVRGVLEYMPHSHFSLILHPVRKTLSAIIEAAYTGGPDSCPSLFLVTELAIPPHPEAIQPPVASPINYPFLSYSMQELFSFLDSDACRGSAISTHHLLIADEQTNQDKTLLFIDRGYESNKMPQTIRLDASHSNDIPVAVQLATMDTNGIRALCDDDGVYRGGPPRPVPKRGEPAPRKQL